MIASLLALSDEVIKVLSASDRSDTIIDIKSFLVSKIVLMVSPTLLSSEAFKIPDKKITLSLVLFSVIKLIFRA